MYVHALPSSHPSDVVATLLAHTSWQVDRPYADLLHFNPFADTLRLSVLFLLLCTTDLLALFVLFFL